MSAAVTWCGEIVAVLDRRICKYYPFPLVGANVSVAASVSLYLPSLKAFQSGKLGRSHQAFQFFRRLKMTDPLALHEHHSKNFCTIYLEI